MNKYLLLPHYVVEGKKLWFLGKEEVTVSDEEIDVIKKIIEDKKINPKKIETLVQKGIIINGLQKPHASVSKVVISPHSDDAALSIGGQMISTDGWKIITVFSTCPVSVNLRDYALTPNEVTKYNNLEEICYARAVGAEVCFLGYKEALERGYEDVTNEVLKDTDIALIHDIESKLRSLLSRRSTVFFPLSIGNHIDHVLLNIIGKRMARYVRTVFYEDQPYTSELTQEELKRQLKEKTKGLFVIANVDITDVLEKKIELAAIYKTQYNKKYLTKLRKYSLSIGTSNACERLWGVRK